MKVPFHLALKRMFIDAFSPRDVSTAELARRTLAFAHRPCAQRDGEAFRKWLENRGIRRLVHFTPIGNVSKIAHLGLIPRQYLELEVVKLVLDSQFTDTIRKEKMPQFNCLSISSPNYAMFYSKRKNMGGRWGVIEFDAEALCRLFFVFTPTNAAANRGGFLQGVDGAEQLFMLPSIRQQLGLRASEPTDPQAESLCDSVLPPKYIRGIFVEHQDDVQWLARKGVTARVAQEYFQPRHDYRFWKGRRITDLIGADNFAQQRITGGTCGTTPDFHSET